MVIKFSCGLIRKFADAIDRVFHGRSHENDEICLGGTPEARMAEI